MNKQQHTCIPRLVTWHPNGIWDDDDDDDDDEDDDEDEEDAPSTQMFAEYQNISKKENNKPHTLCVYAVEEPTAVSALWLPMTSTSHEWTFTADSKAVISVAWGLLQPSYSFIINQKYGTRFQYVQEV